MANLVDKYLNKKKKQIYDYSKLINSFLSYHNSQIWTSPNELNDLLKDSISIYVDEYYFKSLDVFDEYSEYFTSLIKSDNRFKTVMISSIKAIPSELKNEYYKTSLYIISIIVYTSVILNRFTYPYNNYKINIKNIDSIISPMFKHIAFIKYNFNNKITKEIVSLIKKNNSIESRFIKALDELNIKESRNEYKQIDKNGKFYEAVYKYEIPELKEYRSRDVEKYFKRIMDDLNSISYELATTAALKIKLLNKDLTILFPIDLEFYSNEIEISKLSRIIQNKEIKDVIKLYIRYDDYKKHSNIVRLLSKFEFKVALNFEESIEVPYETFEKIKLAIIDKNFINVNKNNMNSWIQRDVLFVEKSINTIESINELKMLEFKEE